jgi:hypothetical protein
VIRHRPDGGIDCLDGFGGGANSDRPRDQQRVKKIKKYQAVVIANNGAAQPSPHQFRTRNDRNETSSRHQYVNAGATSV